MNHETHDWYYVKKFFFFVFFPESNSCSCSPVPLSPRTSTWFFLTSVSTSIICRCTALHFSVSRCLLFFFLLVCRFLLPVVSRLTILLLVSPYCYNAVPLLFHFSKLVIFCYFSYRSSCSAFRFLSASLLLHSVFCRLFEHH